MDNSTTQIKTDFSKTINYYIRQIDQEIKIKQSELDKLKRKKKCFWEYFFI